MEIVTIYSALYSHNINGFHLCNLCYQIHSNALLNVIHRQLIFHCHVLSKPICPSFIPSISRSSARTHFRRVLVSSLYYLRFVRYVVDLWNRIFEQNVPTCISGSWVLANHRRWTISRSIFSYTYKGEGRLCFSYNWPKITIRFFEMFKPERNKYLIMHKFVIL